MRRALALSMVGLGVMLAPSGCLGEGGPYLGHIVSALGADGALHVVAQLQSGQDEGGGWEGYELLYASGKNGSYRVQSSTIGISGSTGGAEPPYQIVLDEKGRPVIVTNVGVLVAQVLGDSGWKEILKGPDLDGSAAEELGKRDKLGAVWAGSDGRVRFLQGHFLYTIRDGEMAEATDIVKECAIQDSCYFAPTGDLSGEAARQVHNKGFEHHRLSCDGTCTWETMELLSKENGDGRALDWTFFLTKDGTANLVLAEGAGPLPSGGFVKAHHVQSGKALALTVVDSEGQTRTIDLGDIDAWGSVSVTSRATDSGDEVHLVTPAAEPTSVTHYVVTLPGGAFTKETFSLQ